MISPDDIDESEDMIVEIGELIVKWANDGKSALNILAVLHTVYNRTFSATSGDEEDFNRMYTEEARRLCWANVVRMRKELLENQS